MDEPSEERAIAAYASDEVRAGFVELPPCTAICAYLAYLPLATELTGALVIIQRALIGAGRRWHASLSRQRRRSSRAAIVSVSASGRLYTACRTGRRERSAMPIRRASIADPGIANFTRWTFAVLGALDAVVVLQVTVRQRSARQRRAYISATSHRS